MRASRVHWLLLAVIVDDLCAVWSGTTVNLVSVLRRDLMKDNEEFDDVPPSLLDLSPLHPPRRADFLQPNKLLHVEDATGDELETYTFEIQGLTQSPTVSTVSRMKHRRTKSTKPLTMTAATTRRATTEATSGQPAQPEDRQAFNQAARQIIGQKKTTKYVELLDVVPLFTGKYLYQMQNHLKTKFWEFDMAAPAHSPRLKFVPVTNPASTDPDFNELSENEAPPNPHELDLAPARGVKVIQLRNKGRVCDRNVLDPEGPKYDVNGHQYRDKHSNKEGDFAATGHPRHVLPRCCNCCKKSVLGCE